MNRRVWLWPVIVLVLAGAYPVGKWVVRVWVDRKIERNIGHALPSFTLTATDGRTVRSDDLRGKIGVLHFLRSFCGSCEREKPAVRALAAKLDPNDVVLWSIMTDRLQNYAEADTQATLARSKFTHPVLMADKAFADAFHGAEWSHVTPIWYVISRDGHIVATLRGTQELEAVEAAIDEARSRK